MADPSLLQTPSVALTSEELASVEDRVGHGEYLGQFDSYRVMACSAVILQHSLLWTIVAGNVVGWSFVMLLHFSRTAFFFLTAFVLTYSQMHRPRTTTSFWRRRFAQLGIPYLVWTLIYWIDTLIGSHSSGGQAWSILWHDLVYGYYQLYFAVVILQLYVVFPLLLRVLRAVGHHGRVMVGSLCFALLLAADLHYTQYFGPIGHFTHWLAQYYPWARNPLTYQEQFVAGVLVALHFDEVRPFVERWYRQIIASALAMLAAATLWYLTAVWTGSSTGRASDLYQPIAFLWFTAAVAALECVTWLWFRRTLASEKAGNGFWSARNLANLTGGIFLCHVLFINLVRSFLGDIGLTPHLGWAGTVALTFVLTLALSITFVSLALRTPLRWVLTGPVRSEERARLGELSAPVV